MSPDRTSVSITSHGVEQTLAIGRTIGQAIQSGDVIALIGPLGAGKTHLVKGIAVGLGLPDDRAVTSPTFVLVNEYPTRLHLFHLDAYRLGGSDDLDALGFDEMCTTDGAAIVVEWADRTPAAMPPDHILLQIEPTGAQSRRLTLTAPMPSHHLFAALTHPRCE